ncbi:hypothetical protein HMPREF0293_1260 [Corynebacterium glucuronolyticum ATCC 51866]|uniref:Uncharacterized protein n=1 Tax=Corynebacterium glucuronolyticum ATCC 51866 TaxID=548478 RepID=A0ABM9XQA3_9CORY|nr:hypothetical protein HMPREF0293_1260 [Corynebacterium glucuronolyticum ATCC 51866]
MAELHTTFHPENTQMKKRDLPIVPSLNSQTGVLQIECHFHHST